MRYYTISFPGEFGQHVVETWSEEQILASYLSYWTSKMLEKYQAPHPDITQENCISDWCAVHWATETDQWGNTFVGASS